MAVYEVLFPPNEKYRGMVHLVIMNKQMEYFDVENNVLKKQFIVQVLQIDALREFTPLADKKKCFKYQKILFSIDKTALVW